MLITKDSLTNLDNHWAIMAVGIERCNGALSLADLRLVRSAIGQQLHLPPSNSDDEESLLEKVSSAYEVAAVEGLSALLHPTSDEANSQLRQQAQAGAFRAFEIRRGLRVPPADEAKVFHVMHLSALAYCSDRWTDLRRWLGEHHDQIEAPSVATESWDRRILFRLYDCWLRLLRKNKWDDVDAIRSIIGGLREDQKVHEKEIFEAEGNSKGTIALRLVALYHLAKATELLAIYILQGVPVSVNTELDQHFEASIKAAAGAQDSSLEILLRWLHITSRRMVSNSLWWVAHAVNSRATRFVRSVTKSKSLFELLPPQRVALQEQGLLDPASRAVVIDLPTSGGKTALAQFRILQALNQFDADNGWVAYVAPTKALVTQITRRLREDFGPLGIEVEQLSGAIEIDDFEDDLLSSTDKENFFHVLVATPEKLQLVIKNKKVKRPLALAVIDEAQNIEDEQRGLRIELLLATIRRDCPSANFLLLMPYVPNADDLARWLASDAGRSISLGTSAWQPNERVVGLYSLVQDDSVRAGWTLDFETLTTTPGTIHLAGKHKVGEIKPLNLARSKASALSCQTAAMAKVFSQRGTSIAVAQKIPDTWSMARILQANLQPFSDIPEEIALTQRFLADEISPNFELIKMLEHGIAVHHAGLSDEVRSMVEWLAEIGQLRVLCATTTIAQGINFPVSSVFLATRLYPYGQEMNPRAFWNLAGRAGRFGHDSVGVVGIAAGSTPNEIREYVSRATGALISRLVSLLDDVEAQGKLNELSVIINQPEWADFRCYVAHLWNEKRNLDSLVAETEQLLRNTFGFSELQTKTDAVSKKKTNALLDATKDYAKKLSEHPENATLADATGFAPEGVASALLGLNKLETKLTASDWDPSSLFGDQKVSSLPSLIGIMMGVPELRGSMTEFGSDSAGTKKIAELASAWVGGKSIQELAETFFKEGNDLTGSVTDACKAIYKTLANGGPWGLSALSKMPTSGIDFAKISSDERRRLNLLPAMMYYGAQTESAILMRMNAVPRSVASQVGEAFYQNVPTPEKRTARMARQFLRSLNDDSWASFKPKEGKMSGSDYRSVWMRLSGVTSTSK